MGQMDIILLGLEGSALGPPVVYGLFMQERCHNMSPCDYEGTFMKAGTLKQGRA